MGLKKATLQPTNIGRKSVPTFPIQETAHIFKGIKLECLRLTRFLQVISRNTLSPCCHQSTKFYLRIRSRPLPLDLGGLSHLFAGFGPNYLSCSSGFKVKRATLRERVVCPVLDSVSLCSFILSHEECTKTGCSSRSICSPGQNMGFTLNCRKALFALQ